MSWQLRQIQQARPARLWLLAGLALAFLPHYGRLPLPLTAFSMVLLGWRLGFDLKRVPLPARLTRWLLTLLALAITLSAFHTLFGRQAGVGLLVVMLSLKLMEMDSPRDVAVAIGLGYFVVITVFLFDQSILMGLYMLLVVTLLTTALIATSRPRSRLPRWHNLRQAGMLLAQAAPITLLLFLLFPRIPGPLWNLPSDSAEARTGLSDNMSPGNISQLSENDAVAFRVQFDGKPPLRNQRYWRGPVFSHFDGKTWNNPQQGPHARRANMDIDFVTRGEPLHYTVTLEPHQQRWLFALDLIAELPPDSMLFPDYEVLSKRPVQQPLRYRTSSYTNYSLNAQSAPDLERYLQLPADSAPRARQLAQQWRAQEQDPAATVQRVLQHLRDEPFYYTRQPPLLLEDPVDEFLFTTRRGFCEHYASAFVFLMRAAGIPARVVTGYQGGEMNPLSDYFMVRQSDAHAWAEVWLRNRGWLRIDPTAVIPPERIESQRDLARIAPSIARELMASSWGSRLLRQLGFGWDNLNHYWTQWIINYNQRAQGALLARLGLGELDWRGMATVLASTIGLVLLVIASRLLRRGRGKRDPVVNAYQRFCRKLSRRGLTRRPAEGARDFAQRARQQLPEAAPAIARITSLYQRLRYAPHPPSDGLRQLQEAVRRFRT